MTAGSTLNAPVLGEVSDMNAVYKAIVPGISSVPIPVSYDRLHCCSTCSLHDICLPTGLDPGEMQQLDRLIDEHRRVSRDGVLYRMNDPFTTLYAIRLGQFKTYQLTAAGEERITGFHMAGEFLGMDAISRDRHQCYARALEDSEVCAIPFSKLEHLFAEMPVLLRHFHRMMSQEITRDQSTMLSLGNMNAEQRFALFLLNLSSRHKARGYSATSFELRMTLPRQTKDMLPAVWPGVLSTWISSRRPKRRTLPCSSWTSATAMPQPAGTAARAPVIWHSFPAEVIWSACAWVSST